jgi:hypothetical protein
MDIQAVAQLLGNFGEFAGSIAVFATLIYVAVQVKQAKHQIDLVGLQTRATQASSVLQPIVTSPDFAQIFTKLNMLDYGEYGLSPEETARFGAWFHTWLQTEQGSFFMLGEGSNDSLLAWMLSTPAGNEFWEKQKGFYAAPFVARVEYIKAQLQSNPLTETEVMSGSLRS